MYGNEIGVNESRNGIIPNWLDGIQLKNSRVRSISLNVIGGNGHVTNGGAQNGITLNNSNGVSLVLNAIGTDFTGLDLGNSGHGISIENGSSNITIDGHPIANNNDDSISVAAGSTGVQMTGNLIWNTGNQRIDLEANGPTANDYDYGPPADHDKDTGTNNMQNYPEFSVSTDGMNTSVQGVLHSVAGETYRLEFFSQLNEQSMPVLLAHSGTDNIVTTDANGEAIFSIAVTPNQPVDYLVLGTATRDLAVTPATPFSSGETSEMSPTVTVEIAGDVNESGSVDRTDVVAMLSGYGKAAGASWGEGDVSGDGKVGLVDLAELQSQLPASTQQASSGGSSGGGGAGALVQLPGGISLGGNLGGKTGSGLLTGGGGTTQNASSSGPTLTVSIVYAGSVDAAGNPVTVDLTDPATNDPSYVHEIEFRIQLDSLAADEDFASVSIDVNLGSGLTDVSGWDQSSGVYVEYEIEGEMSYGMHWPHNQDVGASNSDLQTIWILAGAFEAWNRQYGETPRPFTGWGSEPDALGYPTLVGSVYVQWDGTTTQIGAAAGGDESWGTYTNNLYGWGPIQSHWTGFVGGSLTFGGTSASASALVMAAPALFESQAVAVGSDDSSETPLRIASRRSRETAATDRAMRELSANELSADELSGSGLTTSQRSNGASRQMLRASRGQRPIVDELFAVGGVI